MSLGTYNRIFFSFLGVGLAALISMMAVALLASHPRKEEKRALATLGMSALGVAFLSNIACGIQHKKMRAKGGIVSFEQSGKTFYVIDIPMNIVLAVMLFYLAIQIWRGGIAIAM